MSIAPAALERFWAKVDKGDDCWLWMGARKPTGYGRFKIGPQNYATHRLAYELVKGPIPDGLEIDHLCRVRYCVNPSHLEAVTHTENVRRSSKIHFCPPDHEQESVTRPSWNGKYYLVCRTCVRERDRIRWANRVR